MLNNNFHYIATLGRSDMAWQVLVDIAAVDAVSMSLIIDRNVDAGCKSMLVLEL